MDLSDIHNPKQANGFLGSLRPYMGYLSEDNLHEVMAAIRVLAPELNREKVDRDIVSGLWGMCSFARLWALHPKGAIQRDKKMTAEDTERLEEWIDAIEYAVQVLLHSDDLEEAFAAYRQIGQNN